MSLRLDDLEGQFFQAFSHSKIHLGAKFMRLLRCDFAQKALRFILARRQFQHFNPIVIALNLDRDREASGRARSGKSQTLSRGGVNDFHHAFGEFATNRNRNWSAMMMTMGLRVMRDVRCRWIIRMHTDTRV